MTNGAKDKVLLSSRSNLYIICHLINLGCQIVVAHAFKSSGLTSQNVQDTTYIQKKVDQVTEKKKKKTSKEFSIILKMLYHVWTDCVHTLHTYNMFYNT